MIISQNFGTLGDGFIGFGFLKYFLIPGLSGFVSVVFPTIVAPYYKMKVVISVFIIWVLINCFGMIFSIIQNVDIPGTNYLEVLLTIIGSGVALYFIYEDQSLKV